MKVLSLRLSDELIEKIETCIRNKNIDRSELLRQALEHYFSCKVKEKEDVKQASLKLIITKYNGVCSKCGKDVAVGSLCYFGKDQGKTILICLDCMIENTSDKALASKYLKMRELSKTVKALRKEAEELAEKIEDLQIVQKFDNLLLKNNDAIKILMDYLTNPFINENERKIIEDAIRVLEENKKVANDVENFIQSRFRVIPKKLKNPRGENYNE